MKIIFRIFLPETILWKSDRFYEAERRQRSMFAFVKICYQIFVGYSSRLKYTYSPNFLFKGVTARILIGGGVKDSRIIFLNETV